ncbi:hypothetical protein D9M70_434300 [compost metagenome]
MCGTPVERDRFDRAVRGEQDRAAGGLIDAARLHADEAVLDEIETADAVVAAVLVKLGKQRGGRQAHAVDRDGVTTLEADLDDGRLVRSGFRRDRAHMHVFRGFLGRIFENLALGGGVQQVGVDGERRLALLVLGNRDLVLLGEFEQVGAAFERPVAPGSDDLDIRVQSIGRKLEANLVIALAGGAMGDGVGTGLLGDVD